jgi:hypothetical protein
MDPTGYLDIYVQQAATKVYQSVDKQKAREFLQMIIK